MTEALAAFLEQNLPKVKKKKAKFALGVLDKAFAQSIQDTLEFPCRADDAVREIVRGVRLHFHRYKKELTPEALSQAQLGLGHAYSRAKVKFNPGRADNMIIQSICLLDQLDKDINTFAMRVREWYCWHFPELKDLVRDNYVFAKCAALIGDRASLDEAKQAQLVEKVGNDELLAAQIVKASQHSMGMDCSPVDMVNIMAFTERMVKLAEYRVQLHRYLVDKMATVAPNLSTLIGEMVAARLISKAGSLTSLAKCPASTVQILGAEKALFRALKKKGNTPKYGLIYHCSFIGRAAAKNKGRISRYVANKCAIASRIDSFADEPTHKYGEKMRDQVEERLRFYDTGEQPRKNLDVMTEVANELRAAAAADGADGAEPAKKKAKKGKKAKDADAAEAAPALFAPAAAAPAADGKKKKRAREAEAAAAPAVAAADDDDGDDAAKLAKLEKKLKKATKAGEDDEADRLQTKVDKLKRKLAKSDAAAASEAEPPKKKKKKDKKA